MENNSNEMLDILNYMEAHMNEWPLQEQLYIYILQKQAEMIEHVKPMVIKHMMEEDNTSSTFLFKL